ncbi:MAG: glycosyltransferase, partial [Bacteroidetes bacterium]|nr:glycosyltransferase [Bacteroidota bacterium]
MNSIKDIKILFITPVLERGGTEKYIIALARYIKDYGFIPIAVSDGGRAENELAESGVEYIKVNCLGRKNIFNFIRAPLILTKIIKDCDINLVHASSVFTAIVSKIACFLCYPKKIKLVMTLHGGPTRDIEKKAAKLLNI